jgi:uncharacterized protein
MRGTTIRAKATALLVGLQLAAAAAAAPVAAQNPAVDTLFPARPTGLVTDAAGVVDDATQARIEAIAARLRSATGAELAVVTLPTIGERESEEVALAIGRRWGVGAAAEIGDATRNAGIVVLLVPRQGGREGTGHFRIEVGQGLEGIVTDIRAGQVRRDVAGPLLAQEQYGPALLATTEALASVIARGLGVRDTVLDRPPPTGGGGGGPRIPWLLIILIVFFVLSSFGGRGGGRGGRRRRSGVYWGAGPFIGGGFGGFGGGGWGGGGGFGGGGFGGFGGGGGFSGGGSGGRF